MIHFKEYSGTDTREVAAFSPELEYNDNRLLSQPMEHERTKHTSDRMYRRDRGELNCLFDGLAQEGSIPGAVWKLSRDDFADTLRDGDAIPDFKVRLVSGEEFYLEATTAGDESTIRQENKLPDMSARLDSWAMADADVQVRLRNTQVAFTPQRMFTARQEQPAIEEMQRFILSENLDDYKDGFGIKIDSKNVPTLTAAQVIVSVARDSSYISVSINSPACSFSPGDEQRNILVAVQKKIANEYTTFRPIRLVVALQHVIGHTADVFAGIRASLKDLGPFERIYFANSTAALVATR